MVYIEKLVCKGFKSFGRESVTIKFHRGFTCVMGPNGSGKSNVVDAILFVLGQLSAKTLRANVFSDLLYSPPKPNMPPKAPRATVELYFNNRDRKLQIDADRVVITRELDESGKATCRINDKTVTRTTVLDLLGAIGVDPNGYNLVLQGEIAQIVKVSPIDRRKLIEEIAGISAYDEQKERALKKLAESEANLGKVEAQLQERRRQLERLENERSDALRYTKIRDKIRDIQIDSMAWNLIKNRRRTETINETLAERAEEAEKLAREVSETELGIMNTDREIEEIDDLIDQITGGDSARVSEQYGIVSSALSHVRSDLERAQGEYDSARADHDAVEEELESVQSQISESGQEVKLKESELKTLQEDITSKSTRVTALEKKLEEEQSTVYEMTLRLSDLTKQMEMLDEGVSEIRSALKSDRRELGLAYEELRDAEESLASTEKELRGLSEEVPARRKELQSALEKEDTKRTELESISGRLSTADAEVSETSKLVSSTREELIKINARQEALRDAEEAFLKRRRALASVLELRDKGVIDGIYGTVAELGTIDPSYAVAMEVAGGGRLSYIVVEDDQVATECINALKKQKVGRASFIPLNKIRTKKPRALPDDVQVLGYAIDLVKFEPKMRPAFEFVFSDTIIVEDFKTAKKHGFKKWRAVSLDGDIVERSGLVTGGHYHRGATGLSLQEEDRSPEVEKRLVGLESILKDLIEKQEGLRGQKNSLEREVEILAKKNYRAKMEFDQLEERFTEKQNRAGILKDKITKIETTISSLEEQIYDLQDRDKETSEHRETVRAQRDEANEAIIMSDANKINEELREIKENLVEQNARREELQREVTGLRVAIDERLSPKAIELEHRLESLRVNLPGMEEEVNRLEMSLGEKEKEFENLKVEREQIDEAVKDKRVHQLSLKEKLRNLRLKLEETRNEQTGNEKAVYRLQTEQSRLETDIVGLMAELNSVANAEEELERREKLRELTRREIDEFDDKILELERELEVIGPVNLKALTDYEIEKDRYEEIVDKKTHLEEEHKEIISFMEEIEAEKTKKFLTVYNDIADNFAQVFAKLSPGGEANLMLENPEHPLMGGITVRSKPRGKELVILDAMSGGEKTLTGLALIFAIQMYNPSSFYIFDEIDAALDDVNTHNVALLIAELSKNSQFIVVTLREPTIRKADLLVGVTNQDGISRIVKVDIEEVASEA